MTNRQIAALAVVNLEQTLAGLRACDPEEIERARGLLHAIADRATPNILSLMLQPVVGMSETLLRKGDRIQ